MLPSTAPLFSTLSSLASFAARLLPLGHHSATAAKPATPDDDPSVDRFAGLPPRAREFGFDGAPIRDFLRDMHYPLTKPIIPRNTALEAAVTERLHAIAAASAVPIPDANMTHILRLVPVCASSTELPYHMLCFELKVFITTYTCLFFYCDDMIEAHPDVIGRDLDFFALKYAQPGHTFADGLLQAWLHLIATETRAWYCPTLASFIVTSTLEYLGGAMIESTVARRMTVPRSAPRFAKYLRVKTGNGSAYSAMLFPAYRFADEDALLDAILPMFPDFMELLDGCNDVMSFYKESVVGDETSNYFMVQARSREISPTAVVREGIARQVLLMTDSTATLERNRDVQAAFVEFMEGYLMWHGTASRYRLKELGIRLGPQEEPKFVAV